MKVTLKVSSKGQVTLRREVLDELKVRPGDKIVVEPDRTRPPGDAARQGAREPQIVRRLPEVGGRRGPLARRYRRPLSREDWAGEP